MRIDLYLGRSLRRFITITTVLLVISTFYTLIQMLMTGESSIYYNSNGVSVGVCIAILLINGGVLLYLLLGLTGRLYRWKVWLILFLSPFSGNVYITNTAYSKNIGANAGLVGFFAFISCVVMIFLAHGYVRKVKKEQKQRLENS